VGKHLPNYELEPGHPRFNALATAKHLTRAIEMHSTPQGLLAYWNQEKNRKRMALLPDNWREELERRFQFQLDVLNNAGG
jgi:hypothetical protein